jgi:hypothetical protein
MKPGIKTTELWVVIVGLVAVIVHGLTITDGSINYAINTELLKWWMLAGVGGYNAARGFAKFGNGKTPLPDGENPPPLGSRPEPPPAPPTPH